MEEVDAYIKKQCQLLECSFVHEINDEDNTLFETRNVFEFLIRCIWLIDPTSKDEITSIEFPRHLPTRFRLATTISGYLKNQNIRGDIGFQNLLYGSVNSLRNVLVEVIHKLPSKNEDLVDDNEKQQSEGIQTGSDNLLHEPSWVPEFCKRLHLKYDGRFWCPGDGGDMFSFLLSGGSWSKFGMEDPRQWITDAIQENSVDSVQRKPKPALPPKPKSLTGSSEEDKIRDEIEELMEALKAYTEELNEKRRAFININVELSKLLDEERKASEELASLDNRLVDALKDPEHYKNELLTKLNDLKDKVEHEIDEIERIKKAKQLELEAVLAEHKLDVDSISSAERIQEILRSKERVVLDLAQNEQLLERLKKRVSRTPDENFTEMENRCKDMEDIIQKQENEIAKLREERQGVRKRQIRSNEALDRSFATIQNTLGQYTEAYRGRQALELFIKAQIHCLELKTHIQNTGVLRSDIEQISDEIEAEKRQNLETKCANIAKDISEIESENAEMERLVLKFTNEVSS